MLPGRCGCRRGSHRVRSEFDGVDPLKADVRDKFEAARSKLAHLARELTFLDVTIEPLEPDEELLALVRRMVGRGALRD